MADERERDAVPQAGAADAVAVGFAAAAAADVALPLLLAQLELRAQDLGESERKDLLQLLAMVERRTRPRRPALAWSLNPTDGHAEKWPAAWAALLPRWIARASAFGVAHTETWWGDEFRGTRAALVRLGLVAEGDFPGDPGRGCSMVTFAEDGDPKRQGEGSRQAAVRIMRRGATGYAVEVYAPREELRRRSEAKGLPVYTRFRDMEADRFPEPAPVPSRPGLRLVYARDGGHHA